MINIELKEEALANIKSDLIPLYFQNVKEFNKAKTILLKKLKDNEYTNMTACQPVDQKYLSRIFEYSCSYYEQLIGSLLLLGKEDPNLLLPDLNKNRNDKPINWGKLKIHTIANAESLFQKAQKEIYDIISTNDQSKKRINNVLKEIKPLLGAEPYNDIRRIYWMLYCELRIILQFHKPFPNWDFFFKIGNHPEHWFSLRGERDVPALKYLCENSLDEYENNPKEFQDGLLSDVKAGCVSDNGDTPPEAIAIDITEDIPHQINLFEKIELIPRNNIAEEIFGKEHKNIASITKSGKTEVYILPDEQFVYLYLLAVERKIYKDKIWIWRNEEISPKAKGILKDKLGIKRVMKWFTDGGQKATVMSNINKKISSLIESNEKNYKTYYTLNKYIAAEILFI